MLTIGGEPGIGTTTLWRYAVSLAAWRGFRILAARPGETERHLAYAGLAALLTDSILDATQASVPAPRRLALDAALRRGDATGDATGDAIESDPGTVGLAVLSVLGALAASGPVLVAIDDLQWVDEATLRALEFALRRAGDMPVHVLATMRGAGSPDRPPLVLAFEEERRDRLALGGLSVGAIGRLLHDRLGLALPRPVMVRIHDASDGNPLLALELARALPTDGGGPTRGDLPTAGDTETLLAARIARLPPMERRTLLALSALARPDVEMLEAALGAQVVSAALPGLVGADLVRVRDARVRCAHPLITSVAYATAAPADRREVHARLAEVVRDPEQVARHRALAAAGPDEAVAAALDAASRDAGRRGATEVAAELAELAVKLTPDGDPEVRACRELTLARRHQAEGDHAAARAAAERAVALRPPGPGRTDLFCLLATIEQDLGDVVAARAWLERALDEAGDDRATLARAHVAAASMAWLEADAERTHAQAALDLLEGHETDDPESVATALIVLADSDLQRGDGANLALIDRAVALSPLLDVPLMARPSTSRANYLGLAGFHAESIAALDEVIATAEREGDWTSRPHLLRCLAWVLFCAGELPVALARADQAEAVADELGLEDANVLAVSGSIRAAMGRTVEARDRCDRAVSRSRASGNPWAQARALGALGYLDLVVGDAGAAAEALEEARGILEELGSAEPGWFRVDADRAEALVLLHRLDEAAEVVDLFERRAARGRHPWSLATSARCRGLLEAARGDDEAAIRTLEAALAVDGMDGMAIERGRTLLALGASLRRANHRRAAREVLEAAIDTLGAAGAAPWAARARVELSGVSGRAARPTELSGMEMRVAEAAAAGRANREIADELFLSVRTVESHLSSAYRKLDVRSRTELARALADRPTAGPDRPASDRPVPGRPLSRGPTDAASRADP